MITLLYDEESGSVEVNLDNEKGNLGYEIPIMIELAHDFAGKVKEVED